MQPAPQSESILGDGALLLRLLNAFPKRRKVLLARLILAKVFHVCGIERTWFAIAQGIDRHSLKRKRFDTFAVDGILIGILVPTNGMDHEITDPARFKRFGGH